MEKKNKPYMNKMRAVGSVELERLRGEYPAGCRIVLDEMDDVQAPPTGTQGTVTAVDDTGSICPVWDAGGSLHVVYGADRCHKIKTEAEAKITLDFYGRRQPEEDARCPRCGDIMFGRLHRNALSRRADIMICPDCGMKEALEDAGKREKLPLMQWAAIVIPQSGGGRWKR